MKALSHKIFGGKLMDCLQHTHARSHSNLSVDFHFLEVSDNVLCPCFDHDIFLRMEKNKVVLELSDKEEKEGKNVCLTRKL